MEKGFKYKEGDIVNGRKILKKELRNVNGCRYYYKVVCINCGLGNGTPYYKNGILQETGEYFVEERGLEQHECLACGKHNLAILPNFNSIAKIRPDLIPYIKNGDEYKYSVKSGKKIDCQCIYCGDKKKMTISKLVDRGFSCNRCGDGISYPEKLMYSLLKELNIKFIFQYSPEWAKPKRYDFYFEYNNERILVETHGRQHFEDGGINTKWESLEYQRKNDKLKKDLALANGIKEENYIIIDCRESNLDFIKNNILKSQLKNLLNFSTICWDNVEKSISNNLVKEVCNYWNENYENVTTTDVGKIFNLTGTTIVKYLKKGTKNNWLNIPYNGKIENARSQGLKNSLGNHYKAKETYVYNEDRELLFQALTQKEVEDWMCQKGYLKKALNGCRLGKYKDTFKPYKGLYFLSRPLKEDDILLQKKLPKRKPIYIYNLNKELLFKADSQTIAGDWLVENGYVKNSGSGQTAICKHISKGSKRPYKELYFYYDPLTTK